MKTIVLISAHFELQNKKIYRMCIEQELWMKRERVQGLKSLRKAPKKGTSS